MPKTEKPLRPELRVPQSGLTVNELLEWARTVPLIVAATSLREYQDEILQKVLGAPWEPRHQQKPAPWACPKCGSRLGFARRGSRPRRLRSSLGVVDFELRQVTCLACAGAGIHTTFSPFPELLGLPARARVSEELIRKGVDVATRLSYQQAGEVTEVMTGQRLSATTIHKEVQKRAQDVVFTVPTEAPILLLDSTKVKAGDKKNGIDINLALAINQVSPDGKRRVLDKTLVAMGTGSWESLKEQLMQITPQLILVDGDDELQRLVANLFPEVPCQRCIWHIGYSFAYNLWRGGNIPKAQRDRLQQQLVQVLHTSAPVEEAKATLHRFIEDELDQQEHRFARQFLENAVETTFTHLTLSSPLPGGRDDRKAPVATSYIERQMREINRRVDNGARWKQSGILNLLRMRSARRLAPEKWDALWAC